MENKFEFKALPMKLHLQFFADSFDGVDVDKISDEIAADEEVVVDEIEDLEVDPEPDEVDGDEITPDITTDDGRDAAFAEMRRTRDQFASDAAFIREFAEANGMSVEQLKEQYELNRIAKQAEEQGVPVEVMKRLTSLESENEQVKVQAQTERFNAQVDATMAKYNATQADFDATIKYARENGLAEGLKTGTITFEAAYKLANMDTMIDTAKRDAVQADLATRKKRQQEAPLALGSQLQTDTGDDLDAQIDAEVKEILENGNF